MFSLQTSQITEASLVDSDATRTHLSRKPAFITESHLTPVFIRSLPQGSRSHKSPTRILIPELDGIQGRPDLVDANIQSLPCDVNLDALATCLRSPAKAQLLALLRHKAPRGRAYLRTFTGLSNSHLGAYIRQLERVGLVEVHKTSAVSLRFPLPWHMVDIVSYELKLYNWRRALHQAMCYRSFSHNVWVVMPTAGAKHAQKLKEIFRINGIGLMSVDEGGGTHIEIRSKKRRPASRRFYLMAVGGILSKFVDEGRRLHRRIRPESIQCI